VYQLLVAEKEGEQPIYTEMRILNQFSDRTPTSNFFDLGENAIEDAKGRATFSLEGSKACHPRPYGIAGADGSSLPMHASSKAI
jgi:hypothetical protein